jgi:hypothetical protein
VRPSAVYPVIALLAWLTPAAAQPPGGGHLHRPPPGGAGGGLTLTTLRSAGFVEVALDARRFPGEQVATIRIVNKLDIPVTGEIPACQTVFEPADSRLAELAPAEGGLFVVGPSQTIEVTRPFRALDPSKRPPDGSAYQLSADPLRHDLSRCPEE